MGFLKTYSESIYLGVMLVVVGINCTSWEFYAIMIPTLVLSTWQAT